MPRPARAPRYRLPNSIRTARADHVLHSVFHREGHRNHKIPVHLEYCEALLDNMLSGFILFDILRDETGEPIDYIFSHVNHAFERVLGLDAQDVIGQRATEVFAFHNKPALSRVYHHTAATGEPGTIVEHSSQTGRFYDILMYRPTYKHLAVTFAEVTERVQVEQNLKKRLRVENALAQVSSLLASGDNADMKEVLGILGYAVNANRAYIFLFRDNYRFMDNTHEWCAPGTQPEIHNLYGCPTECAPWWMEHIKANQTIVIPDVASMPCGAAAEQQVLQRQDIKSLLVVPMVSDGQAIGYVGFDDTVGVREWPQEEEHLLRAASDIITSYMERCRALDALKDSEARYRELTDLLPQAIFEIDTNGLFTFANQYALDAYGYTSEDLLNGVNVLQTVTPEYRESVVQGIDYLVNNECTVKGNEVTALRKDGSTFPMIVYGDRIVRDGKVVGIRGVTADITEQKQAEEELRGRTGELEAIVSAFPDIYFQIDPAGVILDYHTSAMEELYATPEQFLGRRFGDVLPRDLACRMDEAIAEANRSQSLTTLEYQLAMPVGMQYYEARYVPLHDNHVLVVIRKITTRKQAEEALRESEQKFRSIFDATLDGLVVVGNNGCVADANPACCELVGLAKADILNRGVREFIEPDVDPSELWHSFIDQGKQRDEAKLIRADGSKRDVEYRAVAHAIAGYHFASIRDITERKQAESEMRLQSCAINAATDQIAITDAAGVIEFLNPSYSCNCGICDELRVGGMLCITRTHPEVWSAVNGGETWRGEITGRDSDGSICIEEAIITPVRNDQGEIEHFVVIKRNITDRKMAERRYASLVSNIPGIVYRVSLDKASAVEFISKDTKELLGWDLEEVAAMSIFELFEMVVPEDRQAANDAILANHDSDSYHLHLRIKARDGDIRHIETMGCLHRGFDGKLESAEGIVFNVTERVREQEQFNQARRMEAVGKLAAGIAHDFNNLLQATLGYTRVLLENSSLDETARLDLLEIEHVSLRSADLVRQILAFSRQTPGNAEPVDMAAVVGETIQLLKTTFSKDIDIVTVVPARLAPILADSSQIYEVLVNLCVNARDAMPHGGKLIISLEQVTLTRKFVESNLWARPGKFLRCVVSDNGQGMSEDALKRAFDPFFTTKPLHKGTGLGLSICYGIVENHNGFMNIDSTLGGGTSVSVFLPVAEMIRKQDVGAEPPSDLRGSETILVVDDEEYLRRLTERLLQNFGYKVIQAQDGERAVEIVASSDGQIDMLLLDLNMPGLSGVAVLETVREIKPELKVLVLSGMDADLETSPASVRPDGVLQKPCQPEALIKAIRGVLDG